MRNSSVGNVLPTSYYNSGFVMGSVTGSASNTSSVILTKPVGAAVGDLLMACLVSDVATFTAASGWTLVANRATFASGYFRVYTKTVAAGDPVRWTWGAKGGMLVWYKWARLFYASASVVVVANNVSSVSLPQVPGTKLLSVFANRRASTTYTLSSGVLLGRITGGSFTLGCSQVVATPQVITRSAKQNEMAGLMLGLV